MRKATSISKSRDLYGLTRNIGLRMPNINVLIKEWRGILSHSPERRLMRWIEHFEEQFIRLTATVNLPSMTASNPEQIDTGSIRSGDQGDRYILKGRRQEEQMNCRLTSSGMVKKG